MTANRQLTAAAGAALLAGIAAELATLADLGALLSVHVFVGVLMAGPLAVKLASTGWRVVRYYARSPTYVREGPPPLALRMPAPLLAASTLAVVGTGFALVVTGPAHPDPGCGRRRRGMKARAADASGPGGPGYAAPPGRVSRELAQFCGAVRPAAAMVVAAGFLDPRLEGRDGGEGSGGAEIRAAPGAEPSIR